MKKLLLIAAAVLAGASGLRAEEYTAISPDGKITVTVSTAPELRWSVTREGERLLDASRIGMKIAGAEPFGAAPSCGGPNRRRIDERSTAPVPTKFRTLHDRCEELLLTFRGGWPSASGSTTTARSTVLKRRERGPSTSSRRPPS